MPRSGSVQRAPVLEVSLVPGETVPPAAASAADPQVLRNPIVEQIRRGPGGGRIFPPNKPRDITTIEEDELARLRATAESMSGWHGSVARFLIGALPFTGLRPREIRLAKLDDVDLANGLWLVSSPKGEGRWAAPGFARIPPIAQQAVADFLAERAEYLAGEESEWLIPLSLAGSRSACSASPDNRTSAKSVAEASERLIV